MTDPKTQGAALAKAGDQFREYARQHRAKNTPEADAKAVVNDDMAAMCDAALAHPPSGVGREAVDLVKEARELSLAEAARSLLDANTYYENHGNPWFIELRAALNRHDALEASASPAIEIEELDAAREAYRRTPPLEASARPEGGGSDEAGWLIEHSDEPLWWTGWPGATTDPDFWTSDSLKSVRFARREDAETIAHFNFDGECRVTEHMWMTPRERLTARLDKLVEESAARVGERVAEAVRHLAALPPEPGGDVREAVARLIDPSSWRVFGGYLADVKRKYKGVNAAYDPEAFKDRKSLAKADAILALISKRQRGYEAQPASVPAEGELPAFKVHTAAVAEFLGELYAIMVDPCAEGTITVAETKAALLSAAIRQREALEPPANVAALVEEVRKTIGEARTRQGNAEFWGSTESHGAANASWDRVWAALSALATRSSVQGVKWEGV